MKGLQAERKLSEDLNLISVLVRKLPSELRREWVRWCSSLVPQPTPGEDEWPKFAEWVEAQRLTALKERWYDEPESNKVVKVTCRRCGSSNHKLGECPKTGTTGLLNSVEDENECLELEESVDEVNLGDGGGNRDQQGEAYQKAARRVGKCPDCRQVHTFDKPVGGGRTTKWPSDQWRNCPKFLALSSEEKGLKIERAKGCPKCSS